MQTRGKKQPFRDAMKLLYSRFKVFELLVLPEALVLFNKISAAAGKGIDRRSRYAHASYRGSRRTERGASFVVEKCTGV